MSREESDRQPEDLFARGRIKKKGFELIKVGLDPNLDKKR